MSAYVAVARIRRVSPRLAVDDPPGWSGPGPIPAAPVEATPMLVTGLDDPLPGPEPTLAERWQAARERWSQLTFFLTDPNSWR